jgi:hypothetical protein
MEKAGTSLLILTTHRNCEEAEGDMLKNGMLAAKYPKLDEETCRRYDEAERVMGAGLSVSGALCPKCVHRSDCPYQAGMQDAERAAHRIATFQRAQLSLPEISKGRKFVTVHEDPVGLLRPEMEVSSALSQVAAVARITWQVNAPDSEKPFFRQMQEISELLDTWLHSADETTEIELPPSLCSPPATADATLWRTMCDMEIFPEANAVKVVKAAADGALHSLTVRVDQILTPGRGTAVKRSLVAIWSTQLPLHSPIWFSDATADPEEIAAICDIAVNDVTPSGEPERLQDVWQIPEDITKNTSRKVFLRILKSVLDRFSSYQRIGIICDRVHVPGINELPDDYRRRISKLEHFRSGEGRGSNSWTDECDFLLILGTPRVSPPVIKSRLIRQGLTAAAAREAAAGWGLDYWSGRSVDGSRVTVRSRGYCDHDWRRAARLIVDAELKQCLGRARSIRESGIPCAVLSTQNLGLPLIVEKLKTANEIDEEVLKLTEKLFLEACGVSEEEIAQWTTFLKEAQRTTLLKDISLGRVSISSNFIAEHFGQSEKTVRRALLRLQEGGKVLRKGKRGGWIPTRFRDALR